MEAGRSAPDAVGEAATARMLRLLEGCEGAFVLALILGGASALLVAPAPGVTLEGLAHQFVSQGLKFSRLHHVRGLS